MTQRHPSTYRVDLADSILWILACFEKLLENGLATQGSVVEEHIKQDESPDMPRCKYLQDLGSRVWFSLLPTFELHALLSEGDFLLGQVKRLGDLGKIRQCEEAKQRDRYGDDTIDDKQPLPKDMCTKSVYVSHKVRT